MFLLLTLNIFHTFFSVSIVKLEPVNINWVVPIHKKNDRLFRKLPSCLATTNLWQNPRANNFLLNIRVFH